MAAIGAELRRRTLPWTSGGDRQTLKPVQKRERNRAMSRIGGGSGVRCSGVVPQLKRLRLLASLATFKSAWARISLATGGIRRSSVPRVGGLIGCGRRSGGGRGHDYGLRVGKATCVNGSERWHFSSWPPHGGVSWLTRFELSVGLSRGGAS